MNKVFITLLMITTSSLAFAENENWIETQKESHIFINKDSITTDKGNTDLKTVTISVNIPSMQDRKANPTKTKLTNPYPVSYLTEFTINCQDKTAKMGEQHLHEKFFGQGKVLEQANADPKAEFVPLEGPDAKQIWEVTCTPAQPAI